MRDGRGGPRSHRPHGALLGRRDLARDHANEQPFTRSLSGVVITTDVSMVTVEPRDLVGGWTEQTFAVELSA